ncbi:MAG: hypothetical protein JSW64_08685 [Candidatus Zixiibacteriota bacterium]|nr:MAG: hypothetical protein JSW64_08685 [candidate division Zixibacteria bacterium]
MIRRVTIFAMLLGLAVGIGCSENNEPYRPVYLREGKISIFNQSGVRIRLMEFTQTRGPEEITTVLNRSLSSGLRYYFINLLDGGDTDIFPGGDYITVHYIADVPNPDDPTRPLFDQTITHTVNGITVYYVKVGGRFSVSP